MTVTRKELGRTLSEKVYCSSEISGEFLALVFEILAKALERIRKREGE